jgi:hypothetical protein
VLGHLGKENLGRSGLALSSLHWALEDSFQKRSFQSFSDRQLPGLLHGSLEFLLDNRSTIVTTTGINDLNNCSVCGAELSVLFRRSGLGQVRMFEN